MSRLALQGSTPWLSIVFQEEIGWLIAAKISLNSSASDSILTAARMRYFGPALGFTKLMEGTTKRFKLIASVYVPWIVIELIVGLLKVSVKL